MQSWTLRLAATTGLIALLTRLPLPTSVFDAFVFSLFLSTLGICCIYGRSAVHAATEWLVELWRTTSQQSFSPIPRDSA